MRNFIARILALGAIAACGSASAAENIRICYLGAPASEVVGIYDDNFGGYQVIGTSVWVSAGSGGGGELIFHICTTNNDEDYLVAQNDAGNSWNPSAFSRFEWTTSGGSLWYCQQVYDAGTRGEAVNFQKYPKANPSNPAADGCGMSNFAWTKLTVR